VSSQAGSTASRSFRPRYDVVLLDAGGTLIRVGPGVGEIYADRAARYGVEVEPKVIEAQFRALWDERHDTLHGGVSDTVERQWWHGLVSDVFDRAGKRGTFGDAFDPYFEELYDLFSLGDVWHVFDDVVPALEALEANGIRCAVVSNWDSRLGQLLDRLGLGRWFEFVFTSATVGYRKPDPRIFGHALAQLGVSAGRAVHVGDSYEDDVLGAQRAGVTPVLIARDGPPPAGVATLQALTGLPQWLDETADPTQADPSGSPHRST